MLIWQGIEENCNFVRSCLFFKSVVSGKCAPTGMNGFKLFLSLISDFNESEISVKFFLLKIPFRSQISDWNIVSDQKLLSK